MNTNKKLLLASIICGVLSVNTAEAWGPYNQSYNMTYGTNWMTAFGPGINTAGVMLMNGLLGAINPNKVVYQQVPVPGQGPYQYYNQYDQYGQYGGQYPYYGRAPYSPVYQGPGPYPGAGMGPPPPIDAHPSPYRQPQAQAQSAPPQPQKRPQEVKQQENCTYQIYYDDENRQHYGCK